MNTPAIQTNASPASEAVTLALSQILDAIKSSGAASLKELAETGDGYLKIISMLPKLSKAELEWREHKQQTDLPEGMAGISGKTNADLAQKYEGPDEESAAAIHAA